MMLTMLSVETTVVVPLFLSTKARHHEESWNTSVGASPVATLVGKKTAPFTDSVYIKLEYGSLLPQTRQAIISEKR
jgi:hypothetical protein